MYKTGSFWFQEHRATFLLVDRTSDLREPLLHDGRLQAVVLDAVSEDTKRAPRVTPGPAGSAAKAERVVEGRKTVVRLGEPDQLWIEHRHQSVLEVTKACEANQRNNHCYVTLDQASLAPRTTRGLPSSQSRATRPAPSPSSILGN